MRHVSTFMLGVLVSLTLGAYFLVNSLEQMTNRYQARLNSAPASPLAAAPGYLFDIRFMMDEKKITEAEGITAKVIFTSFGTLPTPVAMTFTVFDSHQNEVRQEADIMMVETEAVFTKKFSNFHPKPGKYSLVLTTVYGNNIKDEFKEDFEVLRRKFLGIF